MRQDRVILEIGRWMLRYERLEGYVVKLNTNYTYFISAEFIKDSLVPENWRPVSARILLYFTNTKPCMSNETG